MARDDFGFAVPLRVREADGGELRLLTTLAHLGTADKVTVDELTLESFRPADGETAAPVDARRRSRRGEDVRTEAVAGGAPDVALRASTPTGI
jgi:hypothetical protein